MSAIVVALIWGSAPSATLDFDKEHPRAVAPLPSSARDDDDDKPNKAGASHPRDDDDDEDESRVQPDSAIIVTARKLDAARTRIDAALGATVYSLTNEAIENRPQRGD